MWIFLKTKVLETRMKEEAYVLLERRVVSIHRVAEKAHSRKLKA